MKRLVSWLLVLVMLLGILPAGVIAAPEQEQQGGMQPIVIDFKEFARKAAKQPWWKDLRSTNIDGIKRIGSEGGSDVMSETELAAYNSMLDYLSENEVWSIDEETVSFKRAANAMLLYLDNSEAEQGLRFWPGYLNVKDYRDTFAMTVRVPEGGAGYYGMILDLFKEAGGFSTAPTVDGIGQGGPRGHITVNGKEVYHNYFFGEPESTRKDMRRQHCFGSVWLEEGENKIQFELVTDYIGNTNNGRRALLLCGMEFVPLGTVEVEEGTELVYDLRAGQLPFDVMIDDTFAASSDNETVAKAKFDSDRNLVITGLSKGETAIRVTSGGKEICTVDIRVVARTGLIYNFAKGSAVTASGFDQIKEFDDLPDDGVLSDPWHHVSGRAAFDEENKTAAVNGELILRLNVTADGWYLPQLNFYRHAGGGSAELWLDEMYLGTVQTNASGKTLGSAQLRPTPLQDGEYTLTIKPSEGSTFWMNSIVCKKTEEAAFTLSAEALCDKQNRVMTTRLKANWTSGVEDDLTGADWSLSTSSGTLTAWMEGDTLCVKGTQPGDYTVTATAQINGVSTAVQVPVTVLASAPMQSFDAEIPCMDENILVRNTTREFVYHMIGTDGDVILPGEVEISYEVSDETVAVVNEENHTIRGLKNGEVTVTISVQGTPFAETMKLTVADVGENRIEAESAYFTDGTAGQILSEVTKPDVGNAMCWTDVADDGTGNHAIRIVANPDVTAREAVSSGQIVLNNGHLASVEGGQLYEMSLRMKAEGYQKPAEAEADWHFAVALYDYMENARGGALAEEYYEIMYLSAAELTDEWQTISLIVRAPVDYEGTLYLTPRITYGPFTGFYDDHDVSGWEGTFWIDDLEIREVSFDHVVMEPQQNLDVIEKKIPVKVTPVTSTGNPIIIDDEAFPETLKVLSTNEDVIRIYPEVSPINVGDYFNNDDYMLVQVEPVGLNAEAQVMAEVQIGDEVRQGVLDVNMTSMPDILRDIRYTLDGFDSLMYKPGQTAKGAVTGRTTQLADISEEDIRETGNVYFKSLDPSVVKVDAATGDITCVGEGRTQIVAYVRYGVTTRTDAVPVTVTDDTDLADISIAAPVDYVGVAGVLQLTANGQKASGVKADMTLNPVAWSVDDETVAVIDQTGRLTGLCAGTVTVTASIGVEGKEISDTQTFRIVDGTQLAGNDVILDFTDSRILDWRDATLEENGMRINYDRTYQQGEKLYIQYKYGLYQETPKGESLALDFMVPADGWYSMEVRGGAFEDGSEADLFVDGNYAGSMDFSYLPPTADSPIYSAYGAGNTIYLTAGKHTVDLINATKGTIYLGRINFWKTTDPNEIILSAKPDMSDLIVGQSVSVNVFATDANGRNYGLIAQEKAPKFENYYTLSASNDNVETHLGTITAKAPGTCMITVTADIAGRSVIERFAVNVHESKVAEVSLAAERTTVRPDAQPFALEMTACDAGGEQTQLPQDAVILFRSENTAVAAVSPDGTVTITGKEGSARITVLVDDNGHTVSDEIWISVTAGKSEPTLYTYAERENARENVLKYDWAWTEKEKATALADYYVDNLELIYDMWPAEAFPRAAETAYQQDGSHGICPKCKTNMTPIYGDYPWIIDPINNPWKVTCIHCKSEFPSNDFEAYYKSGLNERGVFKKELADESLLVNELYPEMGEGWCVDDGFGWVSGYNANGRPLGRTFIAYYVHALFYALGEPSEHSMHDILGSLMDAYLYTGEEKYGVAGAILVDRIADIYPDYDLNQYSIVDYANADGESGYGKMVGSIWEADRIGEYIAPAVDVFWPAADHPEVIEFLRGKAAQKGMDPEEITPDYLRTHAEDGIILEIFDGCKRANIRGNFGMHQGVLASCAVVLDRLPESQEMVDWLFATSEETGSYYTSKNSGGDVMRVLTEEIDREGFGWEVSYQYNRLWTMNLLPMAEALSGYDRVEGADLWQNPKFVTMFTSMMRLMASPHLPAQTGEAGVVQCNWVLPDLNEMVTAFCNTGNAEIAKAIYAFNGNSVDGIHADIFTKDPESGLRSRIQQIVREQGEWDWSQSEMMSGFGISILREGPSRYLKGGNEADYSAWMMYFGRTGGGGHALLDALKLDVNAFGLNLCGAMGYPLIVNAGDPERMQWVRNTISQNTVIVNDKPQASTPYTHFPLHFEDAGKAKVMDADATIVYPETDIYRRTVVSVEAPNGVDYAVDFFRVLGGKEHLYSFHAVSFADPDVTGLDPVKQPMGTYASADVPFGAYYPEPELTKDPSVEMTGFSWLDGVSRDDSPDTTFSVDFKVEDYRKILSTTTGIHLKLTMLSEEPMSEVALANGHPPQNGDNPEHLEYMLVRRSGTDGMDTLFTAVIEPYQYESEIVSSELVDMVLIDGAEGVTDRTAAVKVILDDGRVDYVLYATNPECTYCVDGKFNFRGFTGVASYYGENIVYAWGNEATTVAHVIEDAQPCVTGKVVSFTEGLADSYQITIEMDTPVSEECFADRYIYVGNDGMRNAAYRIYGAKVTGNTAVLDLHTQTLVREYLDEWDIDLGYRHNISVGDSFRIPLSASFDMNSLFNRTEDQIVRAGNKISMTVGTGAATYEAEGLVTGMKLDAKTGTLTWTTSKTNVGKFPITVKAVKDGEVIASMSFVVYVVNYTGSTYAPDKCSHSKSVDFGTEIVCPACGTITKKAEEVIEKFDVAGSSMTLGNELKLNVLVKATDMKEGYTAKITHNGTTVEQTFTKYNSNYYAVSLTVAAKQMADAVIVEVFDENGKAVSNVYETSVRGYAMNILGSSAMTAKVKTLVVDMLNYGAEAQLYFSYNAEDLANAKLSEEQKAMASEAVSCTNKQVKGKNFYGSNLALEDRVLLNLFFKNMKSGYTAKIIFTDFRGQTKTIEKELIPYSGSLYKIEVNDIVLADAFTNVTATIYDANGNVVGSATDSVESYIARTGNSALNTAIVKFASSAKAYLR